jgi:putative ATP-binding cassette transporter
MRIRSWLSLLRAYVAARPPCTSVADNPGLLDPRSLCVTGKLVSNHSSGPASAQPDRVTAWSLIRPFWVSEERRSAWGLLVAIIAMDLLLVGVNARLNTWNRDFYDALESRSVHAFPQLMLVFAGLAFTFIMISVYNRYLRQMLGFRWRQWLTTRYLQEWLDDGTFYRIERDRLTDNLDQRIAVDLDLFATTTLSLTLDLLSTLETLETLVWFSIVLWNTAGALVVMIGGTPVQSRLHALGSHCLCDCRLAPDK